MSTPYEPTADDKDFAHDLAMKSGDELEAERAALRKQAEVANTILKLLRVPASSFDEPWPPTGVPGLAWALVETTRSQEFAMFREERARWQSARWRIDRIDEALTRLSETECYPAPQTGAPLQAFEPTIGQGRGYTPLHPFLAKVLWDSIGKAPAPQKGDLAREWEDACNLNTEARLYMQEKGLHPSGVGTKDWSNHESAARKIIDDWRRKNGA